MSDINTQRRQFMKTSVGVAAIAIAPGMLLYATAHGKSEGASSKVRWGMLIDTTQCTRVATIALLPATRKTVCPAEQKQPIRNGYARSRSRTSTADAFPRCR